MNGLQATLAAAAELGATILGASIIVNDYQITVEQTESGAKLTAKRGNEVQTAEILHGANVQDITIQEVV